MSANPLTLIDQYELSMLETWRRSKMLDAPATYEVFCRRLTPGLRYGVMAGNLRLEQGLAAMTGVDGLLQEHLIRTMGLPDLAAWLLDYRFEGTAMAYREGDLFFPYSPIVSVRGRLADIVLETFFLSVLNHDTAIASKASRIVAAAQGRTVAEMGSRRTHEQAAVAAARAAYIGGFSATSNVEAGLEYGIPTMGTAAHALVLSYGEDHEQDAFMNQLQAQGAKTTLLIDTYDVERGAMNAVKAWFDLGFPLDQHLGAVRIDSGDLAEGARKVRGILNSSGLTETKILASSDLDEDVIRVLRTAPIDGYGVGTKLVSAPPMGLVYKLTSVDGKPVQKRSRDKVSVGGFKVPVRSYDEAGYLTGEHFVIDPTRDPMLPESIRVPLDVEDGPRHPKSKTYSAKFRHVAARTQLPKSEREPWPGDHGAYLTATQEET